MPCRFPVLLSLTLAVPALAGTKNPAPVLVSQPTPDTLTFSIEERVRGEWRENNFDFDSSKRSLTDDAWLLQRLRLGIDWKPAPWLRFHVEGQDVREFFSDRPNVLGQLGAEGDNALDLRQAFVEMGDPAHYALSLGRMELNYGDGRLISRSPWKNLSQSFDAARLHYAQDDWWLDAFVSSVVKPRAGEFDQSAWLDGGSQTFSGLYFQTKALKFQTTEFYALQLHDTGTDFVTLGTHMKADPKVLHGWDYELELAAQTGTVTDKDLTAFGAHGMGGYQWTDSPWKPRVALEYSYASGDSNPNDGKVGTFQNLFPTNHRFYGYMDVFSWRNLHNPEVRFSVEPTESVTAAVDYHWFWLADTNDAWYRANQTTQVRPITPGASSYAGSELDFTLGWKVTKNLELQAGYAHFFAGDYLKDTGAHDDADFGYLSVTWTY